VILAVGLTLPLLAQQKEPLLPPPDRAPRLVLAQAGPHAPVNALAFAPDGNTLYVAGFDKQVWRYERVKGKFAPTGAFRFPIGPGTAGVVNALAVSPDGKWVAVAGRGPMRGEDWATADDGIAQDFRRLLPTVRRDVGVVYLFDPANPNNGTVIRGAASEVRAVCFASPTPARGPVLVTAGIEWDEKGEFFGTVRAFDVGNGAEIAKRTDLPVRPVPPGLAAFATGPGNKALRIVVGWEETQRSAPGKLFVWDNPGTPDEKATWLKDVAFNSPLAVRFDGAGAAAEVITAGYDHERKSGGLTVRDASGLPREFVPVAGAADEAFLPLGIATLRDGRTAVLSNVASNKVPGQRYELRVTGAKGEPKVELPGMTGAHRPVLATSPDGALVAIAGFADNRIEVYETAALVAGKPVPEKLAGDDRRFTKVSFLAGEKLWLGGPADTLAAGGVVLDLAQKARVAAPRGAKEVLKPDAPDAGKEPELIAPDAIKKQPGQVTVTVAGQKKTVTLPAGARPTAAALLPAKPAWDPALGPLLAVAQIEDANQSVRVSLYDLDSKLVLQLGGPTLPVRTLAFSDTRALLAGAGDDGTVLVWSMKNVSRRWPAIEGLTVTERDTPLVIASTLLRAAVGIRLDELDRGGEVLVLAVRAGSPAAGKFKVNDLIESVADAKGQQKPVRTALDFIHAVRALPIGADAQVKLKGQAAPVAVAVGALTGFRHPLFYLWVDPVAKAGAHDWVGWTPSGPYDTSGEAGEARIGWVVATGDPARPVTFAGANQYRKLFYWRDFIRLLLTTADFNDAMALRPVPRRPALSAVYTAPIEDRPGGRIVREKSDAVVVELADPDRVVDLDRAELEWQIVGPAGASPWKREPFTSARARLDLAAHNWVRGDQKVRVRLLKDGTADAGVDEIAEQVRFVPLPPVLTVTVAGKPVVPGAVVETENEAIEVAAAVDAKGDPAGAIVTASSTGEKPVELVRNPNGSYAPRKVALAADSTTVVLVTATNRSAPERAPDESTAVEVRVRRLAPKVVPPPAVRVEVVTPFDHRTAPDEVFVVSTPVAVVAAEVKSGQPVTEFEWSTGDGPWRAGKLDRETGRWTETLDLPAAGAPLTIRVRAKSKASAWSTDTATLRYDGLPVVTVAAPPTLVNTPELPLTGGLKVMGKRRFALRVLVTSARTGQTRTFDPVPNAALTAWDAAVTLFPGENLLGYSVSYDDGRKEFRQSGVAGVRYVRAPVVLGASPIDVGTGTTGDVVVVVQSPADLPPTELEIAGSRVGFAGPGRAFRVFGVGLWAVAARGVAVNTGADRLKPVPLMVRNPEAQSRALQAEVRGQIEKPARPPVLRLTRNGKTISPDQGLPPVGAPQFAFDLRVSADAPLTRVEVWHGVGGAAPERVSALKVADAVPAPAGGVILTARPEVRLRAGAANRIRVVAVGDGGQAEAEFTVSYAPPPVRVVIDAIRTPDGKPVRFEPGSAAPPRVGTGAVDIEGRVLWDFDREPVATDPNLSVVFVANGVSHLPLRVKPAVEGKERKFAGRVFLNSLDPEATAGVTRIRVDLRSGDRPVPIPQEGTEQASVVVESTAPLRRQRLHVLVLGVEVPAADRPALVRRVVGAVGGELPPGNPNFLSGDFERKGFEFAYLYAPRLGYTREGDLNALLAAARVRIEDVTRRKGEDWVNDVIVVYYHGEDGVDKDGRWYLHSAATLAGAGGRNPSASAIRLDNVPRMPGMPVAVVNVAGTAVPGGDLGLDLPFLRFAWAEEAARVRLLDQLAKAMIVQRTTFGGIADYVKKGVADAASTLTSLPSDGAGQRVVGRP
jgi:hypothetical protein